MSSAPQHFDSSAVDAKLDANVETHEVLQGLARLHNLVAVTDPCGKVLWISEPLRSRCGMSQHHCGQQLERLLASLSDAANQARLREQIAQVLAHLQSNDSLGGVRLDLGRPLRRQPARRGLQRDDELSHVDLNAFRAEGADRRPLIVFILNPNSGAHADAQLRAERDRLADILDALPDAVLGLDRFGFITYVNEAASALLGVERLRLLDHPITLYMPRSLVFVDLVSNPRNRGSLRGEELELERADGSRRWISISARHQEAAGRRDDGFVLFIRDIEDEVTQRRALQRKNAELENYVHSVSHDLRSPLVALLGFTRLLRQDYHELLDETGRHFTDRIEQAGRTMSALVEDLLELCRIGMAREERRLVNPRPILLQLAAELKLRLEENDCSLVLPESPPFLLCDQTRLYQLFSNLIGNAIQHMGERRNRRIEVAIETREREHLICVSDNGRGIAEEDRARIFEVFQTGGKRSDRSRSTGIGLAIVKKIADVHGGRVWVESAPGQGACFYVSLPRAI